MMFYCKKCLMPSTRPRITFDEEGICNACRHWGNKKNIDWNARKKILNEFCDKYRSKDGSFDVVVPVGGGKDSSYVAWRLKHEFGMHPLCVSARPPLQTSLGELNLKNFAKSGFNLIEIVPNPQVSRKIAKEGLIKHGQPQIDWLFAIKCVPLRVAMKFGIRMIVYGEEGESEYGGSKELENKFSHNIDHVKRFYFSGLSARDYLPNTDEADLYWLTLPNEEELDKFGDLCITHWSNFEYWDEYMHTEFAIKHCGLVLADKNMPGSYNKHTHLDQVIYHLHMYLAYLKFGFARATTDACIDLRYGRLTREEAIKLIKEYDHKFPYEYLPLYLEYFDMNEDEFWQTLEKFRNKDIFEKVNGEWKLKSELK